MIKIVHVPKVVYDDKVTYYVPKGTIISDMTAEDIGQTSLLSINLYNAKKNTNIKVSVEVNTTCVDEFLHKMEASLKIDGTSISDVSFRATTAQKQPTHWVNKR